MKFNFSRVNRTVSSEQYMVYNDEELYAEVDIHYAESINVNILLRLGEDEDNEEVDEEVDAEVDEEKLNMLMYELETEVIFSYSSNIKEIIYNVSAGRFVGEYWNKFDK